MALPLLRIHGSNKTLSMFFTQSSSVREPRREELEVKSSSPRKVTLRTNAEPVLPFAAELQRWRGREQKVEEEVNQRKEKQLRDRWREIHGLDDWVGLLDPMDPLLRSELIRYGEMAQACYDAFHFDVASKSFGNCKYSEDLFFQNLGMEGHGYKLSRYLYASPNVGLPNLFKKHKLPEDWGLKADWIGYVAISDEEMSNRLGRRDIIVSWRGTVTCPEWILDLMDILKPISQIPCRDRAIKVEKGFLDLYTNKDNGISLRDQVMQEIERLVGDYRDEEVSISITGHSLGGALAVLSGYDIAETGLNILPDGRVLPISVFSFSGPRVGNGRFKQRVESLGVKVLRVVNEHDMVPKSPGFLINERVPSELMKLAEGFPWSYCHVGEELVLDHKHSPFLKDTSDPRCSHNLEVLLHLLDGYHGRGQRFVLASGRDVALVNKECDVLKDHYRIPPYWHQGTSMVSKDGPRVNGHNSSSSSSSL